MPTASNGPVSIYYETFGDPSDPTLLLVNGLGSQCINYRAEWCEKFAAAGFFTIRFDNRDVGLSTKFADFDAAAATRAAADEGRRPNIPYNLGDMARDAIAVLDDLGIERAHVMGLSMGGMIVQTLAIEHPERLLSMTSVMSTTGDPDVGQASPEAMALLTGPAAADRDGAIALQFTRLAAYGSPGAYEGQDDYVRQVAGEAYDRCNCPEGVARQMMAIWGSGSRSEALRSVGVPTLVMHGDQDKLVDISGGRRTAEVIPGARFVVMEGMGHDYPPSYWDRWVELVTGHARAAVSA